MVSGHRKTCFEKSDGKTRYQDILIAAGTVKERAVSRNKERLREPQKLKKGKPKTALYDTVDGFR